MSSPISQQPVPGDPRISGAPASKPRPKLGNLDSMKPILQDARKKAMEGSQNVETIVAGNKPSDVGFRSKLRLAKMWSKTGGEAIEFIKGAFISALNHLKVAFKSQETKSSKKELDAADLKPVINAPLGQMAVPGHKKALRSLIMEKQGQPTGSIEIHFEEPVKIEKLKSEKIALPTEGNRFVKVSYSSKPYGAKGEKDSDVILIAGDQKPGGAVNLFAQEEVENEKHPVLTAMAQNTSMGEMRSGGVRVGEGQSRGAFMKGVPKQCDIDTFKTITVGNLTTPIYGGNFKKSYNEYLEATDQEDSPEVAKQFIEMLVDQGVIEIYDQPKSENILYMVAPRASEVQVTTAQGYDLLNAIALPYIAALKQGATTLPFGPVGTGAFGNNFEFSLLTGLLAAEYARGETGNDMELVYHDPGAIGAQRTDAYTKTVAYFDETIRPMIESGQSIGQMMKTLVDHANEQGWKNNPSALG